MKSEKRVLVGNDMDVGEAILIILGILTVCIIIASIFFGGVIIGGIYSIKNYFASFKHNVIDDNFRNVSTT